MCNQNEQVTIMNLKFKYINQGFTLMELMIVVAIVGILSAVAIPAYNGYMESGRIAECTNEIAAIKLAQKQYFLENNRYFPDPDGVADTAADNTDYQNIENESGGYFRSTYRDHGTIGSTLYNAHVNCDYKVTSSGSGSTYEIEVDGIRNLSSTDLSAFTVSIQ